MHFKVNSVQFWTKHNLKSYFALSVILFSFRWSIIWTSDQMVVNSNPRNTKELAPNCSTLCLHLILSKKLDLFPIFSLCSDYLNIRLCFIWDSVHMEPIPTALYSVWMAASPSMLFLFFVLYSPLSFCMGWGATVAVYVGAQKTTSNSCTKENMIMPP